MSRSTTLAHVLAGSLRQALRDGAYVCGERLAEISIAREMNVSQNTARDALSVLEGEGWLIKRPRHGFTVRTFSSEEASELYRLRETLEALVLDWALEAMSLDQKANLARILAEARIQANMGNDRGMREAIGNFHEELLRSTEKPLTMATVQPLLNQSRLLVNLRARYQPDTHESYAERLTLYADLVTAIRYNDLDAAQSTLKTILKADCEQLLPVLDLVV
jgi:DNA-binding GntR family transcriptional regulator